MTAIDTPTSEVGAARSVSPEFYLKVVWFSAVLLAGIIFTGAAVRLTSSGLGCEDWPQCSADRVVPEWGFHPWIEFGNRLISGLVAVSVAAAVLLAYRRSPRRTDLVRWSWGLVAGVLVQIVLGGVTVLVDLHPMFVAVHFLLSAVLMANVLVLAARAQAPSAEARPKYQPHHIWHSRLIVLLASLVLIVGTLVTGSGPHGGDTRADRLDVSLEAIARAHSLIAWLLVAATVAFALTTNDQPPPTLRRLVALLVLQGAIGYWQYASGIPAGLVELHIIGAVAVWCSVIWMHLGLSDRSPAALSPTILSP